jgi:hypothetical protein
VDTQFTRALAARARELAVREWSLELMGARYLALIRALAQQN